MHLSPPEANAGHSGTISEIVVGFPLKPKSYANMNRAMAYFTPFSTDFYPLQIQRFVFVNYSSKPTLQKFHGKTVALDTTDRQRPYAVSFLVHLS
ncbi:hypothetical protein JOM56_015713 [Amanita muscaria]